MTSKYPSFAAGLGLAWLLSALVTGCGGSGASASGGDFDAGEDTGSGDTTPLDDTTPPPDTTPPDTGDPKSCSDPLPTGTGEGGKGCAFDQDCDGIADAIEGRFEATPVDTDKDGVPDYLDTDSDNDTIPDKDEWVAGGCEPAGVKGDKKNDADEDGIPNFRDTDSDGNGLPDKDEICPPTAVLAKLGMPACDPKNPYDFDGDGTPDYLDFDNDHDSSKSDKSLGLADIFEMKDNDGKYVGPTIDTDGDGIPDVFDVDSDGDGIRDLDDGSADSDGDKIPNFRDLDSDGDGVPDRCEARGKDTIAAGDDLLPVTDTNANGIPDFLDRDSDGDYLADGKEDKNGNCKLDPGETDRLDPDTDKDGSDDLVEVVLLDAAAARDPSKDPFKAGKFYFKVPYSDDGSAKPTPKDKPLALETKLKKGDIGFAIDTSTSMNKISDTLADKFASSIIPKIRAQLPEAYFGVIGYDDVLLSPYGGEDKVDPIDRFIWFPGSGPGFSDASKGSWLTGEVSVVTGAMSGFGGRVSVAGDYPEGTIPAIWWTITGEQISWGTGATAGSFAAAAAVPADRFGGMRFRKEALPIVINASDANFHNGKTLDCGGLLPCSKMAYGTDVRTTSLPGGGPTLDQLATKLGELGAKYIGLSVHGGTFGKASGIDRDPTNRNKYHASYDMLDLARSTKSVVDPGILGGSATDCKTSAPGATKPNPAELIGGANVCPLVFDVTYDGDGVSDAVVNAVVALVKNITVDVHVEGIPEVSGTVDPVDAFLDKMEPLPTGGTDPVTGGTCVTFDASKLIDRYSTAKAKKPAGDIKETIGRITPAALHCFAVTPKPNVTVKPADDVQIFRAKLRVVAENPGGTGGSFTLGTDREVIFVVPPKLN